VFCGRDKGGVKQDAIQKLAPFTGLRDQTEGIVGFPNSRNLRGRLGGKGELSISSREFEKIWEMKLFTTWGGKNHGGESLKGYLEFGGRRTGQKPRLGGGGKKSGGRGRRRLTEGEIPQQSNG